jgi:hypothetical protein
MVYLEIQTLSLSGVEILLACDRQKSVTASHAVNEFYPRETLKNNFHENEQQEFCYELMYYSYEIKLFI